jgi:hypothetical protein
MKSPEDMRPGNRYAREAQASTTLRTLIERKAALVAICRVCKHRRLLFPASLANQLGETLTVIDLRKRLKCRKCGAEGTANLHASTR